MLPCYLVVGPESSGNRMMGAILNEAGAVGDAGLNGPFAKDLPPRGMTARPVVVRSFPHAGKWPALKLLSLDILRRGYFPVIIIMTRELTATARSQVANGHQPDEDNARASALRAMMEISTGIQHVVLSVRPIPAFHWVTYEAVTTMPLAFLPEFLGSLELRTDPITHVVVDGVRRRIECQNAKHYTMLGAEA